MQLVEGEGKNKIGGGQKKKEKMKGGERKARWTLSPIGRPDSAGLCKKVWSMQGPILAFSIRVILEEFKADDDLDF
jgi:hypothetical protein